MKRILFVMIVTIVWFASRNYIEERTYLLQDISKAEDTMSQFSFELEAAMHGSRNFQKNTSFEHNEHLNLLQRNFNWWESFQSKQHPYQFRLDTSFGDFLEVLYIKKSRDVIGSVDQEAYKNMRGYIEQYQKVLQEERTHLNGIWGWELSSILHTMKVPTIMDLHQQIDQLSMSYSQYQQLPSEMNVISEQQAKERLRTLFSSPDADVHLSESSSESYQLDAKGFLQFDVDIEGNDYSGEMNAYTGEVPHFRAHSESTSGDVISKEKAEQIVDKFLHENGDGRFGYEVTYLGMNHKYTSNVDIKRYSYKVTPTYNDYPLHIAYQYDIDARTGEMVSKRLMNSRNHSIHKNMSIQPVSDPISKQEATEIFTEQHPDMPIEYEGMLYIPSLLSNQYELVHEFSKDHEKTYIRAQTGKVDVSY
ncbi:PepSY domain-containing protein [Pontibacillus yanchengensis]|nr:PepSY domain-containing protein [Pontibacillus yanchengensis]